MATTVIIVRHGQSTFNAQQKIQGKSDLSVLTEKGISDARQVGKTLENFNFDAFYCSPLTRAKQTAETIVESLENAPELQTHQKLQEIDLPLWENLTKTEVKTRFAADYRQWKEQPDRFKMVLDGGKEHFPVPTLYQQAREFWQEIISQNQDKTILIVAHNGINRCLIMSAIGIPVERYHTIQQSNCCINVLNFTGDFGEPVQLESLNQTSHLGITLPSPRQDKYTRLLLVRHGETEWNRVSRFQGIKDIPLNENGKKQGNLAAEFLKEVSLDFAVSSTLLRPKETAELILQYHPGVDLKTYPELVEISHGVWEGKLKDEVEAEFPGMIAQWQAKPETVQMPEGENLQQVWDRAIAAWNQIAANHRDSDSEKTGIVVAHDAINKVILCYLLGLKPDNFWNIKQGNGAVSVIDYYHNPDSLAVLQAINITSHLSGSVIDKTAAGAL
ncbi:MAG: histidine phosphatase family protein [Prochloraceae cyanobacterium]|nr:histidine phosphatase family protein [Prochloraceae cyanobacterium]